jgi:hypothetical protein
MEANGRNTRRRKVSHAIILSMRRTFPNASEYPLFGIDPIFALRNGIIGLLSFTDFTMLNQTLKCDHNEPSSLVKSVKGGY